MYYDIFLPGDYFFDLIYTDLPEFPMLGREVYSKEIIATGGAMFITATSLRRLGVQTGWAACFGKPSVQKCASSPSAATASWTIGVARWTPASTCT